MDAIQSKINVVKSRIAQIETSDMFTAEEKELLLNCNYRELQFLQVSDQVEKALNN